MSFWYSQDPQTLLVHAEPGSKYFYLLTLGPPLKQTAPLREVRAWSDHAAA